MPLQVENVSAMIFCNVGEGSSKEFLGVAISVFFRDVAAQ